MNADLIQLPEPVPVHVLDQQDPMSSKGIRHVTDIFPGRLRASDRELSDICLGIMHSPSDGAACLFTKLGAACRRLRLSPVSCRSVLKIYNLYLCDSASHRYCHHDNDSLLICALIRLGAGDARSLTELSNDFGLSRKKLSRLSRKLSRKLGVRLEHPLSSDVLLRFAVRLNLGPEVQSVAGALLGNSEFVERSVNVSYTTRISMALFLGAYVCGTDPVLKLGRIEARTTVCRVTLLRGLRRMTAGITTDRARVGAAAGTPASDLSSSRDHRPSLRTSHQSDKWPERICKDGLIDMFGLADNVIMITK